MTQSALILGATGRFGRSVATALTDLGWTTTAYDRQSRSLESAAQGHDLIVNGWNPAYPDWARDVPRQTKEIIAAVWSSGARLLHPGNLYVYGQDLPKELSADTPWGQATPLGQIRQDTERAFRDANIPVILIRAGDFIDTQASGNWFDKIIAANRGRITAPGCTDLPHAWAFLPDLAHAAACLATRRTALPHWTEVLFPGHTASLRDVAETASVLTGRHHTVRRMSWVPLHLARPFWPMAKPLIEMRYLWKRAHQIASDGFDALLPGFVHTPFDQVLAATGLFEINPNQPVRSRSRDRGIQLRVRPEHTTVAHQ